MISNTPVVSYTIFLHLILRPGSKTSIEIFASLYNWTKSLLQEQDRGVPVDDETTPYEEVQNSSSSAYAELNRNQNANADNTYQKLVKRDSNYVIPNHDDEEPSYEDVEKKKSPPGYTDLNETKRVKDDDEGYQKLVKK